METLSEQEPGWVVVEHRKVHGPVVFHVRAGRMGRYICTDLASEEEARLIAAAPDLLEAALTATKYGVDEDPWWGPLKAAIAKAELRQT